MVEAQLQGAMLWGGTTARSKPYERTTARIYTMERTTAKC